MRRLATIVVVVAFAVVAACGGDDATLPEPTIGQTVPTLPPSSGDTTSSTVVRPIAWSPCGAIECGTLAVPLDWNDPDGETITLALVRVPASDPSNRIGSLLVNPGGPGGSGVEFVRSGFRFKKPVSERFDLISWDPRGVGESSPLSCGDKVDEFLSYDSQPDNSEEQGTLNARAKAVADECGAEDMDLLGHISTDDTVRDMDAIRASLGEQKISYYGFSYGTYIGERYLELFPANARAVGLDGVVDPAAGFREFLRGQTVALEQNLQRVFAGCDNDSSCPVNGSTAAVYDKIAAKIETNPLPAGTNELGPSELATAALYVTYSPSSWDVFYGALAAADDNNGSQMYALADAYRAFGGFTVYAGVECIDSPHPNGGDEYKAFADELASISPRLGAAVANELLPCAYWPVPPVGTPGDVHGVGGPPVLVVGNTGDAATPYSQAVKVAGTLEQGALLTYEGEGHTSYGKSGCVDDAVSAYLIDLTVPDEGATC